jgi:G3E family GTPase
LSQKQAAGQLRFDRVMIETTGLADPAPVAQTFFVDDAIYADYRLDAMITVVDAVHAMQQLDEHHEAQEQVGFADRILLSKTDLVAAEALETLQNRIRQMNARAPIQLVHFGQTDLKQILDIQGFSLEAILQIEPDFLQDVSHEHDDDIQSFVFKTERPFDLAKLEVFLEAMIEIYGTQLLRYKGIVSAFNDPQRIVFQGVHMLMSGDHTTAWQAHEKRQSTLVFIGKNLPQARFEEGLNLCLV